MIVCNACYGQQYNPFLIYQDTVIYTWPNNGEWLDIDTVWNEMNYTRKNDTVMVLCQVSDTSRRFHIDSSFTYRDGRFRTVIDTFDRGYNQSIYWQELYSVRELHNTREGQIDPDGQMCIRNGEVVPCWHNYYQHIYYLDKDRKPLQKSIVVWQAIEVK